MTMAEIKSPLTDVNRNETGQHLQSCVVDLIDLSLVAKQLHWNVIGPRFRDVHLQLDLVVDMARLHTDALAERCTTIGVNPDGRARTVAADSAIDVPAAGFDKDAEVVERMSGILQGVSNRFQEHVEKVADTDPVTQDLIIAATEAIQEQSWMWQAMAS